MHLHIHRMSRRLPKAAEGGGDGGTHGHRESAPSVRPPANLTACETSRRRFRAYACTTSPGVRPREVLPPNCASCDPNRSSASRPSSANAARSRCRRTLCSRIGEREPARAAAATAAVPDRPQPSAACLGTCRRSASSPVALTSPQLTTFVTKSLQCAGGARFRSRSECRRRDRSGTARRSCEVSLPPRTGSSVRSAYWAPVTRRKARACRRLLGATGRQTLQSSPCGDYTTNQCAGATTQVGGVCYLCVQLSTACAPGKQW